MATPGYKDWTGYHPVPEIFNASEDTYNVKQTIYPDDLMGPASSYGNNMVVFYISVQSDSKLIADNEAQIVNEFAINRMTSELESSTISETEAIAIASAEGGAKGAAGGAIIFGRGKVGGLLGAGFQANAATNGGNAKRGTKSIKQAIALYMPANLSTQYSMGWDTAETSFGSTLVEGAEALEKSYTGALSTGASSIAAEVLRNSPTTSRLSATAGNPKKEQIFQGVDFRNFNYDYNFWPRSSEEAKKVKEIIKLFKLHMHPEFAKSSGNFLFLYPSEFDIRYYHREGSNGVWRENLNIHRHTSCVLTNMQVSYGNNGVYSSFKDGNPTQINVNLQFKELAILTKENIQNGF